MANQWVWALALALGCAGSGRVESDSGVDSAPSCECSGVSTCCDGCHALTGPCDDGLSCSSASTCQAGACVSTAAFCAVTWPACQTRACSEVSGCGPVTPTHEGFACDDGNAGTYGDACSGGTCAGTAYACTVSNGGCGTATCIGHDPAPPTCQCSGRYDVTAAEATDTTTGLVWQRAESGPYTQAQAVSHCAGLGGGWRLPTSAELLGIHTGATGALPRIDGCAFPGTTSTYAWSSTAGAAGYGKTVDFGGCCGDTDSLIGSSHPSRCVR